jgi:hypothetical protein
VRSMAITADWLRNVMCSSLTYNERIVSRARREEKRALALCHGALDHNPLDEPRA